MKDFYKLVKHFHIWSQGIYPGEFSYFPSLGDDFSEIELEFDHMRSQIVSLVEGLAEGRFTDPQNAVRNNLADIEMIEISLLEKHNRKDSLVYLAWVNTSRELLKEALELQS